VFLKKSIDIWQILKEKFSKVDRIRVTNIRSKINNLKQGSKSILDYFSEIQGLWEKLNSHMPLPTCTCVYQCRCDVMRATREFRI